MGKDLFQIGNEKGIYLTINLWAMLSPRLAQKKEQFSGEAAHKKEGQSLDERGSVDVNQCC